MNGLALGKIFEKKKWKFQEQTKKKQNRTVVRCLAETYKRQELSVIAELEQEPLRGSWVVYFHPGVGGGKGTLGISG